MVRQLFVVTLILFISQAISSLIGSILPSSVIGLILLFIALCVRIIQLKNIEAVCDFVIAHMSLLLVVSAVGIMEHLDLLFSQILYILVPLLLSVFAGLAAAGWTTQYLIRKKERRR